MRPVSMKGSMRTIFVLLLSVCPCLEAAGAEKPGWHASGKGGAVVAENPKAVAAGIELLEKGGNAVDAAVATMLVASIMDYGMFCIGAEVPFMIYDAKEKEVKVILKIPCGYQEILYIMVKSGIDQVSVLKEIQV